ncbi:PmoA family protein [Verrucomicrobia bacterium]|nr:PmoA family protein [Verrucomicrobiota bacterium]
MKYLTSLIILALIVSASASTAAGFSIDEKKGESVTVSYGGRSIVHLMTGNDTSTEESAHATYKVYLHVDDPSDANLTITKGAGGKFTHHRGIYIGWSKMKIDGKSYDTWHMKNGIRQHFDKLISSKVTKKSATFIAGINWIDGDGTLLTEKRTFTIHKPNAKGAFVIDKSSEITCVRGDTDFAGDPEHAGLQFRASNEVAENKSAKYLFPSGVMDQKSVTAARDLPWAALSFEASGNHYHVQHMSHLSLPKPIRYSAYRDYGRFGAFMVTTAKKGETKTFKVRFYLSPGEFPDSMVQDSQKRYAEYIER